MTSQLLQRPGKLALMISLLLPLIAGCTTTQATDQTSYSTTATQASFSEAQLDSLLAPIALYPDTVLSHVLIASTYPLEVVEADRWARNNSRLKGDDAVNAVDNQDWDPSVKALVSFPDILQRMSDDLDWTQQLGDAFLASEERVMDSIQKLRNRAYAAGNLDKVEHVRVVREEKTIVIEPSVERVVYVPAYDTRVVYGNWWWADYPPVYWHYPSSYVFVSGFYWGPRVYIGPRFYFSGCHWNQRRVVVVDRHHHHNHNFYDSRSVVRYANAKHWHHNPVHRRGVAYYDNHTRERFNSPRESYGEARQYRAGLRDNNGNRGGYLGDRGNSRIAPNNAREQRQGRDDQAMQRLDRRQAGQITTNSANVSNDRAVQGPQPRAEQLRERMNNRNGRDLGNLQSRDQNNRTERQGTDIRQAERRAQPGQSENRNWENRLNNERSNRIERTEAPRTQNLNRTERQPAQQTEQRIQQRTDPRIQQTQQQSRLERPTIQRLERTQSVERAQPVERPQVQQVERREAPRVEQVERTERFDRPQRIERSGGNPDRQSGGRTEMRGGRER
jgi:hypothetical protein